MRISTVFFGTLLLCTSAVLASNTLKIEEKRTLLSNKVYEKCFNLNKDEQIQFQFKADTPLLFNIHYHNDKEVIYPIAEQLTPEFKTTSFTAPETQHYCLMWSNPQQHDVAFEYRIKQ